MKRKAMIYESLTLEKKHKFISPICRSPKIMMIKHFCSIFRILAIYKTTEIKTFLLQLNLKESNAMIYTLEPVCCKKQKKKQFLISYWFEEVGTPEGPEGFQTDSKSNWSGTIFGRFLQQTFSRYTRCLDNITWKQCCLISCKNSS